MTTNSELAEQKKTTSRQISKSRRRGWILVNGEKVKYTASPAVHIVLKAQLKKRKPKTIKHEKIRSGRPNNKTR